MQTAKRINLSLTNETAKKLEELCKIFDESYSPTIRRCIAIAYSEEAKKKENN